MVVVTCTSSVCGANMVVVSGKCFKPKSIHFLLTEENVFVEDNFCHTKKIMFHIVNSA